MTAVGAAAAAGAAAVGFAETGSFAAVGSPVLLVLVPVPGAFHPVTGLDGDADRPSRTTPDCDLGLGRSWWVGFLV